MRKIVSILGIPIDDLDTAQVLERLEEFVASGRFHQVATANVDFLVKAHNDPELKQILRVADLVVPDGMPVVWASRLLRAVLRERVTGVDLVWALTERAAQNGYRIFMLGGEPDIATMAKARLEQRYPGLQIVGCESPDIPSLITTDCEELIKRIALARPDVLLVAFGNPKQEKFIHMHRSQLQVPVCIGVGGTFDFIAGKTRRAPRIVQKLGLEFLHRWTQNPKRLGPRYKTNLAEFPPLVLRQVRSVGKDDLKTPEPFAVSTEGSCQVIVLSGFLGWDAMRGIVEPMENAFSEGRSVVLNVSAVRGMDSFALGSLLNLWKRGKWARCEIRITGPGPRFRNVLEVADATHLFPTFGSVSEAARAAPAMHFSACVNLDAKSFTLVLCGAASAERVLEVEGLLMDLANRHQSVCLDLREVSYVDCGMLSVLARFADNRRRQGLVTTSEVSQPVARAMAREKLAAIA